MSPAPPVIALLGFGEAGSAFARDLLAQGVTVRAYDPKVTPASPATVTKSEADAVSGAEVVLSVNSAHDAVDAITAGIAAAAPGAVWADMNTASPSTKQRLAEIAGQYGIAFADIAIMAPVPGKGLSVPMLVSGDGAERASEMLRPLGVTIDIEPGEAGVAATRKLLRSVFFKGLAAAVFEALEAGRAAGCEEWLRSNIVNELSSADATTVDRLVSGTVQHAARRADEMAAAAEMLSDLGVEPSIARASRDLLVRLTATANGAAEH